MKQIGIMVMFFLTSLLVSAQHDEAKKQNDGQTSKQSIAFEKRQTEDLAQLTKQLSLTPEQQASITQLQKNLNDATKAYRASKAKDPEHKAKRDEMKKLRNSYDTDFMSLLTKKQKTKYEAFLKAQQRVDQPQNTTKANQGSSDSNDDGGGE